MHLWAKHSVQMDITGCKMKKKIIQLHGYIHKGARYHEQRIIHKRLKNNHQTFTITAV